MIRFLDKDAEEGIKAVIYLTMIKLLFFRELKKFSHQNNKRRQITKITKKKKTELVNPKRPCWAQTMLINCRKENSAVVLFKFVIEVSNRITVLTWRDEHIYILQVKSILQFSLAALSFLGQRGTNLQQPLCKRRGPPWTGH